MLRVWIGYGLEFFGPRACFVLMRLCYKCIIVEFLCYAEGFWAGRLVVGVRFGGGCYFVREALVYTCGVVVRR